MVLQGFYVYPIIALSPNHVPLVLFKSNCAFNYHVLPCKRFDLKKKQRFFPLFFFVDSFKLPHFYFSFVLSHNFFGQLVKFFFSLISFLKNLKSFGLVLFELNTM